MIRASKHTIRFANQNKLNNYHQFLQEYRRVAALYLDYLWVTPISYTTKNGIKTLDIKNNLFNVPQFISTINIPIQSTLSARVIKCLTTQVLGITKAVLEKPCRRLYQLEKLTKEGKDSIKLQNKINRYPITKPDIANINPELNSICCNLLETAGQFNAFLQLHSLGSSFEKIRLPIKYHRQSNKWKTKGKPLNSFLLSGEEVTIRWDIPNKKKRISGKTLGADQGLKDILTFSNTIMTPHQDIHGHTLESIISKLARKKKGSKAFGKVQVQRENFINWSINQLNFKGIKQINLENIININYGKNTSRKLKHWTNTLIRDKLEKVAEEEGFCIFLQSSTYRSQRCSQCGLVRKANRKGKLYECKNCGLKIDADLNAAINHAEKLPDVPIVLRKLNLNHKGFFWKPKGFYALTGEALTVPFSNVIKS